MQSPNNFIVPFNTNLEREAYMNNFIEPRYLVLD